MKRFFRSVFYALVALGCILGVGLRIGRIFFHEEGNPKVIVPAIAVGLVVAVIAFVINMRKVNHEL